MCGRLKPNETCTVEKWLGFMGTRSIHLGIPTDIDYRYHNVYVLYCLTSIFNSVRLSRFLHAREHDSVWSSPKSRNDQVQSDWLPSGPDCPRFLSRGHRYTGLYFSSNQLNWVLHGGLIARIKVISEKWSQMGVINLRWTRLISGTMSLAGNWLYRVLPHLGRFRLCHDFHLCFHHLFLPGWARKRR